MLARKKKWKKDEKKNEECRNDKLSKKSETSTFLTENARTRILFQLILHNFSIIDKYKSWARRPQLTNLKIIKKKKTKICIFLAFCNFFFRNSSTKTRKIKVGSVENVKRKIWRGKWMESDWKFFRFVFFSLPLMKEKKKRWLEYASCGNGIAGPNAKTGVASIIFGRGWLIAKVTSRLVTFFPQQSKRDDKFIIGRNISTRSTHSFTKFYHVSSSQLFAESSFSINLQKKIHFFGKKIELVRNKKSSFFFHFFRCGIFRLHQTEFGKKKKKKIRVF